MHSHTGCLCLMQAVTLMHTSLTFTTCSRSLTYFFSVSINSWTMFLQEEEEIGCLDARITAAQENACKKKVTERKQQKLGKPRCGATGGWDGAWDHYLRQADSAFLGSACHLHPSYCCVYRSTVRRDNGSKRVSVRATFNIAQHQQICLGDDLC